MPPRYEPVDSGQSFPEIEERVLARWRELDVFHETLRRREGAPLWVFYEGPPTANGAPGSHHVLARVFKDIFPRYKTMCGYQVPRKAGWDCHGLPVELEVERQLGISSKHEIEEYGIAEFNQRCRESVFSYVEEWNRLTERIGFWMDLDDAYVTLAPEYVESVWWALRQIWDKDLLYEGHKVVPYCPRCGTALSSHEVAVGYRDVVDPSIYVRFPVRDPAGLLQTGDSLLIWTTTPWTLVANAAVAVDPELTYVRALLGEEVLVLAESRVEAVLGEEARVLERFSGADIAGARYEPPFPYIAGDDFGERGHTVLPGDFVSAEDGTGLVHAAVAFGEDDFRLGEQHGLAVVNPVRADGTYDERIGPYAGRPRRSTNQDLIEDLQAPRPAAARRGAGARLSALLALRHRVALLRQGELVHPHDGRARPDAGGQRGGRVVPIPHQARPFREVAREQRRLGAVAGALLGHAAAGLALRAGPRPLRRLAGRAARAGRLRARGPAQAVHRRGHLPLSRVRPGDAPRARGDRRLVRLGRDAFLAVPPPVRERGRVQAPVPRGLHLRGARPDPRLVLLAARDLHAPVRPLELQERPLPGADPRPRRPEDVQEPRQRRRALGRDRPPRRGRVPLVLLHLAAAVVGLPLLARDGGGERAQVPAHALEHLQLLRAVRERRRVRPRRPRRAGRRPARPRPLGALASAGNDRDGAQRARLLRHDLRRAEHRRVRRRSLELVRAPQPAALLEPRRRRGRLAGQAVRLPDPARGTGHGLQAAGAVHPFHRRRDLRQPRRHRAVGAPVRLPRAGRGPDRPRPRVRHDRRPPDGRARPPRAQPGRRQGAPAAAGGGRGRRRARAARDRAPRAAGARRAEREGRLLRARGRRAGDLRSEAELPRTRPAARQADARGRGRDRGARPGPPRRGVRPRRAGDDQRRRPRARARPRRRHRS